MTDLSVRELLREVADPEIPAINIVELGIVRGVQVDGTRVDVEITPTYSGCPAMREIERAIHETLTRHGFSPVTVRLVYREPWTTDWIEPAAREKLRQCGIAPPGPAADALRPFPLEALAARIRCPYCGSRQTECRSVFSGTACKSLHHCRTCQQPFEQFKAI